MDEHVGKMDKSIEVYHTVEPYRTVQCSTGQYMTECDTHVISEV